MNRMKTSAKMLGLAAAVSSAFLLSACNGGDETPAPTTVTSTVSTSKNYADLPSQTTPPKSALEPGGTAQQAPFPGGDAGAGAPPAGGAPNTKQCRPKPPPGVTPPPPPAGAPVLPDCPQ